MPAMIGGIQHLLQADGRNKAQRHNRGGTGSAGTIMQTRWAVVTALAAVGALCGSGARADGWVDELKAGVLDHDFIHRKESGVDFNGEVLFTSPAFLAWLWAPRPHIGFSVNSAGDTDQAYAGLTWTLVGRQAMFVEADKVFVDYGFGVSFNDGDLDEKRDNRKELGSRALFRLSLEAGYSFVPHHSLSAYVDHESNAGLSAHNEGMNAVGIRYGYQF
jgi:lipid A 3-O-deacylase